MLCYTTITVDLASVLLLAVALSMDCFAVSVGASLTRQLLPWRQILRVALFFGAFQAGMLVAGWLAGRSVVEIIKDFDHWVAFGLLIVIGGRMIWEAREEERPRTDITKLAPLLVLSVGTSIDALAAGLGLAFLEARLLLAAALIGSVTFGFTIAGFFLGKRFGGYLGRWADLLGGLVLIGIGIRVLVTHLLEG